MTFTDQQLRACLLRLLHTRARDLDEGTFTGSVHLLFPGERRPIVRELVGLESIFLNGTVPEMLIGAAAAISSPHGHLITNLMHGHDFIGAATIALTLFSPGESPATYGLRRQLVGVLAMTDGSQHLLVYDLESSMVIDVAPEHNGLDLLAESVATFSDALYNMTRAELTDETRALIDDITGWEDPDLIRLRLRPAADALAPEKDRGHLQRYLNHKTVRATMGSPKTPTTWTGSDARTVVAEYLKPQPSRIDRRRSFRMLEA